MAGGGFDHQFFNTKALDALDAKETAWQNYLKEEGSKEKVDEFTIEDDEKREKLISEGWPTWNKKDFFIFIKMAETYGRAPESFEYYRTGLPYKTAEEIQDYSKAFWKNYKQIENWNKYIDRI